MFRLLLLLLPACVVTEPGETPCDSGFGTVHLCGEDEPGAPLNSGRGRVRKDVDDLQPVEAPLDLAGCVDLDLAAGLWEVTADNGVDCYGEWVEVTVVACESTLTTVPTWLGCVDGR